MGQQGFAVANGAAKAAACSLAVAAAGCYAQDNWHGEDKVAHAVLIGGLPAFIVSAQAESRWAGFATGAALGLGKEVIDATNKGGTGFSGKDLVWTLAGAALGAYMGGLVVTTDGKETRVTFARRF